ncbi:hypothetical protein HPB47_028132 [Ixodes persulcatus]|uniref:Uncharacterized protein n=1 Tax=Ixodes persulcatus TaxID=34615 RepID=A0AC60PU70_IXOPE|nr:hypothetical protein HPB47_028132 [Ixodes persulcatus]
MLRLSVYADKHHHSFATINIIHHVEMRSHSRSPMSNRRRHIGSRAKDRCNGLEIDGRKIRVDYSITQRAHTPTPGIYMGKPS